jgi:hypothetical protein
MTAQERSSPLADLKAMIDDLLSGTGWSPCYALKGDLRRRNAEDGKDPLYRGSGIYCLVVDGQIAYVGESGGVQGVFGRIGDLAGGVYRPSDKGMPFTDPHVCAPAGWAWRQEHPSACFEVSTFPISLSTYWRRGLENLVIAHIRQRQRTSPWWNFGRMVPLWTRSTERKRGKRGERTTTPDETHLPGIAPLFDIFQPDGDPVTSQQWAGHQWSPWIPIPPSQKEVRQLTEELGKTRGLYRMSVQESQELYYIGHGSIANAVSAAYQITKAEPARLSQGADLLFSYVPGNWRDHEGAELICDAVAQYLLQKCSLPAAQYRGDREPAEEQLLPRLQERTLWLFSRLEPLVASPFVFSQKRWLAVS